MDLIIRGGQLIDGTGVPPVRADIGIANGKICEVGDLSAKVLSKYDFVLFPF